MKFAALSLLSMLTTTGAFAPSFVPRPGTSLDARKPFITGNWKLNPQTKEEAVTLASEIAGAIGPDTPDIDVALFVPYVFIESAMDAVSGKMFIGAEVSSMTWMNQLYLLTAVTVLALDRPDYAFILFHRIIELLYYLTEPNATYHTFSSNRLCVLHGIIRAFALRSTEPLPEPCLRPC